MKLRYLLAMLCLCPILAQADIYKAVDADGHATYSAQPVKDDKKTDLEPQPPSDESNLTSHNHYINKDGQVIHSPSTTKSGAPPPGASAQCGDGTYSFSQHHRGTCSRHGGVAQWL